jgi:uncharacterized protein YdiU (UPF0061 family)
MGHSFKPSVPPPLARRCRVQVPTTRALCCVGTGDQVLRDMFYNGDAKFEPGAVVCRVSPSFVRFGTFQLPVSRGGMQTGLVKLLADYGEYLCVRARGGGRL